MSEIPRRPVREDGKPVIHRRVMTADEIREREVLNRDNTAPRLRARVLATSNGHSSGRADGNYRADWPR